MIPCGSETGNVVTEVTETSENTETKSIDDIKVCEGRTFASNGEFKTVLLKNIQ